jgi:prepilin-type N-terminal cleavage/methylation domain-containing protein
MDRLKRDSAGFTLIEVMVALGILAAGLLTVAAAQLYAMQGGSTGRHSTEAAAFAHTKLENLQRMAFDDAELADTAGAWAPAEIETNTVQTTPIDIVEMTYTVEYRVDDIDPNLKAVDVRVTWDEPKRPGRSLTLSSQLHDDPPTGG